MLVAAWSADALLGGRAGWGLMQIAMGAIGLALALTGAALLSDAESPHPTTRQGILAAVRKANIGRFCAVWAQIALLVIVAQRFRVESPALYDKVLVLAAIGFPIHHLLPARYRLRFFVLLSLAAITYVFGLESGVWLVVLGLLLIGTCHLRLAFATRVVLLALFAGGLTLARAAVVPVPWSAVIWPILGSMFMFRLIAYMYDLRHASVPPTPGQALAYFFLLPNVAFPRFPVVDFATFRRTYYDRDAYDIYQRGVQWIVRGLVHLLLYRLVYQHLTISPADVQTAADLVRYLVANFLLYLRVSGQFHLIVGLLHLFGFRLPETHHFFFLAPSFTEFWRRINIYWKDFMQKVFCYPAHFAIRKRRGGETFTLVLSTLVVFVSTWFFHSYQWFWILGRWLMSWTDVLFWATLAVLLIVNALYESRHGRARSLGARPTPWRYASARALRAAGMLP